MNENKEKLSLDELGQINEEVLANHLKKENGANDNPASSPSNAQQPEGNKKDIELKATLDEGKIENIDKTNPKDETANTKKNTGEKDQKDGLKIPDMGLEVDSVLEDEISNVISSTKKNNLNSINSKESSLLQLSDSEKEPKKQDKADKSIKGGDFISSVFSEDENDSILEKKGEKDNKNDESLKKKGSIFNYINSSFQKEFFLIFGIASFFSLISFFGNLIFFTDLQTLIFSPIVTFLGWLALIFFVIFIVKSYFPEFATIFEHEDDTQSGESQILKDPIVDDELINRDEIFARKDKNEDSKNDFLSSGNNVIYNDSPKSNKSGFVEGYDFSFDNKDMAKAIRTMMTDE